MPWEKKFNVDQALGKAMILFWEKGYEATSMQDLVNKMGINRGSLYDTFGDKRQLFIAALNRYDQTYREQGLSSLLEIYRPKEAIHQAFIRAVDAVNQEGLPRGCLLVNTSLELSSHDEEVAAVVAEGLRGTERFFRSALEKGRTQGELSAALDPEKTAQGLLGLFIGLRVLSRSRPEPTLLQNLTEQAMLMLV